VEILGQEQPLYVFTVEAPLHSHHTLFQQ